MCLKRVTSLVFLVMSTACVSTAVDRSALPLLTIGTLDLFTQEELVKGGGSWLGDWSLRRERLLLVDQGLREIRPDIMFFQDMVKRNGSLSETDRGILSAGVLQRYQWNESFVREIPLSGESVHQGVSSTREFGLSSFDVDDLLGIQPIGKNGYLGFHLAELGGSNRILLVNVKMPDYSEQSGLWYNTVKDKVMAAQRKLKLCKERIVLAGFLPFDEDSSGFLSFLESLELKDSSQGKCQNSTMCQTLLEENPFVKSMEVAPSLGQFDRILVHRSAKIETSLPAFEYKKSVSSTSFGFDQPELWASKRLGWMTKVSLPGCF